MGGFPAHLSFQLCQHLDDPYITRTCTSRGSSCQRRGRARSKVISREGRKRREEKKKKRRKKRALLLPYLKLASTGKGM